jgi:hypothetical protein
MRADRATVTLSSLLAAALLSLAGACAPRTVWTGGESDGGGDGLRPSGDASNPAAKDYIYLVDDSNRLLRFDPPRVKLKLVGLLQCPVTTSVFPHSMSVDRDGRGWVLYQDGQVFWVDTRTASCNRSDFEPNQLGFKQFGMGFVSDSSVAAGEKLYISGSAVSDKHNVLGWVDPGDLKVREVGPLPKMEQSPELTGTAEGKLYGYFPGSSAALVARLDPGTGKALRRWNLPGLGREAEAWAFAHWGGKFYIFNSVTDSISTKNRVQLLLPGSGTLLTIMTHSFRIVGAGVSIRAPTVTPDGGPGGG